jgi:Holliday junction resolvase RusA-like endonuclease
MSKEIVITIELPPVTKKNSQRIVVVRGRPMVIPSAKYKDYEKACSLYVHKRDIPIDSPVNIKCEYYMPTRRRVDLVNLLESTLDILVKYGVLADDNSNIVVGHDGSKVEYDKERPRTIITISPVER